MDLKKAAKNIEAEIQKHKEAIDELSKELMVLEKYLPSKTSARSSKTSSRSSRTSARRTRRKSKSKRVTFKDAVNSFFDDGVPKKARELFDLYKEYKGNADYKINSFLPQLSQQKALKKHEFVGETQKNRFYYGRLEWFDGDSLKQPYIDLLEESGKVERRS